MIHVMLSGLSLEEFAEKNEANISARSRKHATPPPTLEGPMQLPFTSFLAVCDSELLSLSVV